MPGFDRSGPKGQGSMTGRGREKCNSLDRTNNFPTGRGRGLGMGFGRGTRCQNRFQGFRGGLEYSSMDTYNTDSVELLKAETASLKTAINTIEKQIEGLKSQNSID